MIAALLIDDFHVRNAGSGSASFREQAGGRGVELELHAGSHRIVRKAGGELVNVAGLVFACAASGLHTAIGRFICCEQKDACGMKQNRFPLPLIILLQEEKHAGIRIAFV